MDGTEHGMSQVASGENSPLSSSFSACILLIEKNTNLALSYPIKEAMTGMVKHLARALASHHCGPCLILGVDAFVG